MGRPAATQEGRRKRFDLYLLQVHRYAGPSVSRRHFSVKRSLRPRMVDDPSKRNPESPVRIHVKRESKEQEQQIQTSPFLLHLALRVQQLERKMAGRKH